MVFWTVFCVMQHITVAESSYLSNNIKWWSALKKEGKIKWINLSVENGSNILFPKIMCSKQWRLWMNLFSYLVFSMHVNRNYSANSVKLDQRLGCIRWMDMWCFATFCKVEVNTLRMSCMEWLDVTYNQTL